jgi:hypothetical protein
MEFFSGHKANLPDYKPAEKADSASFLWLKREYLGPITLLQSSGLSRSLTLTHSSLTLTLSVLQPSRFPPQSHP